MDSRSVLQVRGS
ncbi:hypothetical protein MTR67_048246 [Solanum verrucosum]|nr:hypothetical protein MTR67_000068 [Solanum verrucosum]WMV06695.1 hypothetical protein MTR67_000080 [Solanum verrucosum]WMV09257.1 hypothetical protein MTR67_002642 [Solanum verrucosum]WMV09614.1 hypothetical protein MTR67_002999 [Solanum verrucosum]WMV09946.1 hypothetical protein MTR67_003331 [Solanum verrucosum]